MAARMTDSTNKTPPSPRLCQRIPLRAWFVLWALVAVSLASLLAFNARLDTYLWCATRWAVGDGEYYTWADYSQIHAADPDPAFYMVTLPPLNSQFFRRTAWFWARCKSGGEAWPVAVAVVAIALFHRRQRLLAAAAAAGVALAALLTSLISLLDGRYRPTHTDGANHWELFRGFHNTTDLAFPSSHATVAFATAAALSYVFPCGRPLFLALAALTAISRVVHEAHFWSDVLCGATLGWSLAWFTMYYADKLLAPRPPRGNTDGKTVPTA
jgi:membrane-associated phospholipid phosphatase